MGAKPYPTMSNLEVLQYVRSGGRLERPSGSPGRLHFIMTSCWSQDPDHRPTFKMCVQEIESLLDAEAELSEISGYTLRRGHEFPGTPSLQPELSSTSTSSVASSHYHSATTMPVSQVWSQATTSSVLGSTTPPYLQLVGEEYVVPRPEQEPGGSGCGCTSGGEGTGGYQNLRTEHGDRCTSASQLYCDYYACLIHTDSNCFTNIFLRVNIYDFFSHPGHLWSVPAAAHACQHVHPSLH